jgi:hypothetical protein
MKKVLRESLVTHNYNSSTSGGRDQEALSLNFNVINKKKENNLFKVHCMIPWLITMRPLVLLMYANIKTGKR